MKLLRNILFYLVVGLIPFGLVLRTQNFAIGTGFLLLGLTGIALYFTIQIIRELKKDNNILLFVWIILMSITLYTRYLNYVFWDYPSLIIIPVFIFLIIRTVYKNPRTDIKLKITVILYFILTIPLFGADFHKSPRQYIPRSWYNRYGNSKGLEIELPYAYKYEKTKQICSEALELHKQKRYKNAIKLYKEARKIEPKNPSILFELSESYARYNELETALALLDTAIMIDKSFSAFYNNRGLLYYKLKENDKAIEDYKKAIELDSTLFVSYGNIALVYYEKKMYDKTYEAIAKAEELGINLNDDDHKELKTIKRFHYKYAKE